MREATVRELWTYPVKGCQGIASESIEVTQMGVVGDRGFVLWRRNWMDFVEFTSRPEPVDARCGRLATCEDCEVHEDTRN